MPNGVLGMKIQKATQKEVYETNHRLDVHLLITINSRKLSSVLFPS